MWHAVTNLGDTVQYVFSPGVKSVILLLPEFFLSFLNKVSVFLLK